MLHLYLQIPSLKMTKRNLAKHLRHPISFPPEVKEVSKILSRISNISLERIFKINDFSENLSIKIKNSEESKDLVQLPVAVENGSKVPDKDTNSDESSSSEDDNLDDWQFWGKDFIESGENLYKKSVRKIFLF